MRPRDGCMRLAMIALGLASVCAGCAEPPRSTVVLPPSPPEVRSTPVPESSAGAHSALQWARARIGSPYQWGGTGASGFDCSGLVQVAYARVGVRLPRTAAEQARRGQLVPRDRIRPGDLVFFGSGPGSVDHVGIASGGGRFVHASSSRGVVEDSLGERYFRKRFVFARRVTTSAASH